MKRLISLFLMMCLLTSICAFVPMTVSAATSGTCGENLTWTLDDNGMLTISGTGDMYDYSGYTNGFDIWKANVNAVVIDEGVTSIGMYSFYECGNLTHVTIPNSIVSIHNYAFAECTNLAEINWNAIEVNDFKYHNDVFRNAGQRGNGITVIFGSSVKTIPSFMFSASAADCRPNIIHAKISDSVKDIGDWAFGNCYDLLSVTMGNGVENIGSGAFNWCNSLTSITIPQSVTNIGDHAFNYCENLTNITIPQSVTNIGEEAFCGCVSLSSIRMGANVTSIERRAFAACDALTKVYYYGNEDNWNNISIEDGNSYLTDATIHYTLSNSKDMTEEVKKDRFPENIVLDYYAVAGREWIELYDLGATVEIEDENVARLEDGIVVADIGSDTADYISKQIVPVSPGKTTITAQFSDGTIKKSDLTVTGIKIMLNGQPIVFDQPPINQNGNLLVPIRMIAENMGKEVLWSTEANAAFIDNSNNALIVPIGETTIYLGDEKSYSKWETVKTNVPSQVINGRTLVPIRQFSEALGADVNWIDKYSTATISYDNIESEAMSNSLFDAINLNYYIGTDGDNPFTWYTDNVVNPFYDSRNPTIDKITMGIGKPWTAVTELFAELYGDTNASINLQKSLYEVLNEVPEDTSNDLDLSLLKDLKEYAESGLTLFDEVGGLTKDFLDSHKSLEPLNDSLLKVAQSDTTGKVFGIFDWTVFTAEELAYWLSDYSANISYLDALENAIYNQGMLNSHMQHAIADLRIEYSNKFLQTLFDIWDEVVDKGFSAAMEIATGKAYGLGKVAWGTIFNATGVTKKGEALRSFYSLYCYNGALDREFSDVILSSKNNVDIAYVNALINLQKATKTVAVNSIADMSNWWAKDEVNQSADELKTSLNSWSYYIWER